jgi:hypothetical protein
MTTDNRWIGWREMAEGTGVAQNALHTLGSLSRFSLPRIPDPDSPRRKRQLFDFQAALAWLDYHLGLSEEQRRELERLAIHVVPGLFNQRKESLQ